MQVFRDNLKLITAGIIDQVWTRVLGSISQAGKDPRASFVGFEYYENIAELDNEDGGSNSLEAGPLPVDRDCTSKLGRVKVDKGDAPKVGRREPDAITSCKQRVERLNSCRHATSTTLMNSARKRLDLKHRVDSATHKKKVNKLTLAGHNTAPGFGDAYRSREHPAKGTQHKARNSKDHRHDISAEGCHLKLKGDRQTCGRIFEPEELTAIRRKARDYELGNMLKRATPEPQSVQYKRTRSETGADVNVSSSLKACHKRPKNAQAQEKQSRSTRQHAVLRQQSIKSCEQFMGTRNAFKPHRQRHSSESRSRERQPDTSSRKQ